MPVGLRTHYTPQQANALPRSCTGNSSWVPRAAQSWLWSDVTKSRASGFPSQCPTTRPVEQQARRVSPGLARMGRTDKGQRRWAHTRRVCSGGRWPGTLITGHPFLSRIQKRSNSSRKHGKPFESRASTQTSHFDQRNAWNAQNKGPSEGNGRSVQLWRGGKVRPDHESEALELKRLWATGPVRS